MAEWVTNILSALIGAILALSVREFIEWLKRPNLKIDFEEKNNQKPFIINNISKEFNWEEGDKHLRIGVLNKGLSAALNCEAKLEISLSKTKTVESLIIPRWSRREPPIYVDNKDIYQPITINRMDTELLSIFHLLYSNKNTDNILRPSQNIVTGSYPQFSLQPNFTYKAKVTIFSSNAEPSTFSFTINWDGTVDGFDKAFRKD